MVPAQLSVEFKKLSPDAVTPTYARAGDAGLDLSSIEAGMLMPGQWRLFKTGIAVAIPYGYVGLVHPRSGLAYKAGISIVNAPGTIDSGYRGEIMINLINFSPTPVEIEKGDRIAQLVIQKVEIATLVQVAELNTTARGANGHGSTGVKLDG